MATKKRKLARKQTSNRSTDYAKGWSAGYDAATRKDFDHGVLISVLAAVGFYAYCYLMAA